MGRRKGEMNMKKVLKFSGACAAVLAIVAFILMLATPAVIWKASLGGLGTLSSEVSGVVAIFGQPKTDSQGAINVTAGAVIAFVLILAAILILIAGVVLPILKIRTLEKFAGVLNLVAVLALVAGGILMFFEVLMYCGAQEVDVPDGTSLGAGWVIGGILAIVSGVVAILPAVFDFVGSKK